MHQNKDKSDYKEVSQQGKETNKEKVSVSAEELKDWYSILRGPKMPINNFWKRGELIRIKKNLKYFLSGKKLTSSTVSNVKYHAPKIVDLYKQKEITKDSVVMFVDGSYFQYKPLVLDSWSSKNTENKNTATRYILSVLYNEDIASIEFDKNGRQDKNFDEFLAELCEIFEKI